jgi:hypothetical protein
MGLAERRAVKAFQEITYPPLKAAIVAAAGFELPIEVDWESLAEEDRSEFYEEAFAQVFFEPLLRAIEGICIDDLGRDALKAGLSAVHVRYDGTNTVAVTDRVLSISFYPTSNLADGAERAREIQRRIEKAI